MAGPNSELSIVVAGKRFGGWLNVRVSRGMERAAADFSIDCTQRWPGQDERFDISEGSPCEVWIGADKVLTGYVEKNKIRREATAAICQIAGRSKTCDLVDCSPDFDTVEFAGLTLARIAARLAKPFGIEVVAGATAPALPIAAAHHGETVWKLVERLARQQELLVMDDTEGRLVLDRLGSQRADDSLVHPSAGLLSIEISRDISQRFSEYRVKAQAAGGWAQNTGRDDDEASAESIAHVESAVIVDNGVTRYRPKTILAEGAAKKEGVDARADWEARHNIGQSLKVNATVVKWRQPSSGKLWVPNLLVPVVIPSANVDALMALSEVTYRKTEQDGEVVDLVLVPPAALTPEPPETPAAAGGNSWLPEVLRP